jgi:hypothetical protein
MNSFVPPSLAGTWTLQVPKTTTRTESAELPDDGRFGEESVFTPDERCLVDERDYQDGGKYRCKY